MLSNEVYEWLHQNPELSYNEFKTTKFIINHLSSYDLDLIPVDPTGVIAVTKTNHPKTIVFRADIDGLAITEQTDTNYSSINPGVMHGCGHDIHITSLLEFVSKIDFELLSVNIIFVFQPGEEVDGGARKVINNPIFNKHQIVGIYASHVWPELDLGTIGLKVGTMMATNYVFNLKLKGTSTHCSTPHLGSEMFGLLTAFTNYLNTINSKMTDLNKAVAINIGQINGGKQPNITLSELSLKGTIRAQEDRQLKIVVELIDNFLQANCSLYKIDYKLTQIECSYPCVDNDRHLIEYHGLTPNLTNGSFAVEDFGFYKQLGPTLFVFAGTHEQQQMSLHSEKFLPSPKVINIISNYYLKILGDYDA